MNHWLETLQQAATALADHRLRTALSILGITIGIAAVMAVSTVSKGGNHIVFSELETFGLNSIWVYRNWRSEAPDRRVRSGSGIDNDDYSALRHSAGALGIRRITPITDARARGLTLRNRGRYARASVLGVDTDYFQIVNDSLLRGRAFNLNDLQRKLPVAVLAPDVVRDLFEPGVDPLGQSFRYHGQRFQVIGLLAEKSRDFLASIGSEGGQNANDRVLIPNTLMQKLNGNRQIGHLQIEVQAFEQAEATARAVAETLQRRHQGIYSYQFETMASYIRTTDRILSGVAVIGVVAASISLLVGGMGILNMMSTSVLERTREIGIRKAVGASQSDIRRQFLLEATLISVIGGVSGLLFGVLVSVVLARVTGFPLTPSPATIAGALLVSVLVGILSGYLPARRAARLHPVEALRSH